jgi:opacity protein-like surface antigen
MRHTALTIAASFMALTLVAGSANAQDRGRRDPDRYGPVPAPGMIGIGGSFATSWPGDPSFAQGLTMAGNGEAYFTRRVSLRVQVSGSWWDIQNRGFDGDAKPIAYEGNVVYNFEGGRTHPYVTGGVGLYDYRFHEGPSSGSATKPGFDVGGGLEYFVQRHTTLTGEFLFHDVAGPVRSPATTFNTSNYWSFTVGVKRYLR